MSNCPKYKPTLNDIIGAFRFMVKCYPNVCYKPLQFRHMETKDDNTKDIFGITNTSLSLCRDYSKGNLLQDMPPIVTLWWDFDNFKNNYEGFKFELCYYDSLKRIEGCQDCINQNRQDIHINGAEVLRSMLKSLSRINIYYKDEGKGFYEYGIEQPDSYELLACKPFGKIQGEIIKRCDLLGKGLYGVCAMFSYSVHSDCRFLEFECNECE